MGHNVVAQPTLISPKLLKHRSLKFHVAQIMDPTAIKFVELARKGRSFRSNITLDPKDAL